MLPMATNAKEDVAGDSTARAESRTKTKRCVAPAVLALPPNFRPKLTSGKAQEYRRVVG